MNALQVSYYFCRKLILTTCVFVLYWLIPFASQAQTDSSINYTNAIFRDSLATTADTSRFVINYEQRIIFQILLLYGPDFFTEEDPFLPKGATYGMLNSRQIPSRNNIDQLLQSVEHNLREYNKQKNRGEAVGGILNYLSFLLLFYNF